MLVAKVKSLKVDKLCRAVNQVYKQSKIAWEGEVIATLSHFLAAHGQELTTVL